MVLQRVLAATAAVGSVAAVLWVGRRNPSAALIGLFVVWVLLPFVGLIYRRVAHWVAVGITLGSLAVYGYAALGPPQAQVAKWFLMVPLASWVVILATRARRT